MTEKPVLPHLKLNAPGKGIVVTIDDGPIPEHCDNFLAACDAIDLKTYCFVAGKSLQDHPDLGKKLLDHGHVLCNHSYTHPRMTKLSPEAQAEELDRCTEEIIKLTGSPSPWFRFPYLDADEALMELVSSRKMTSVGYQMYTQDPDLSSTPEQIVARLDASFHRDGIVLGHHWSAATRAALQVKVPQWREAGCFGGLSLELYG
ncbi:polysaccharide deacetylase family protein [Kiritimatiellaeota bacterium B1221]|nr:polysaccharide deacetylase family protein [Kiritimatiellaeota bacterium B1221]